ncbi:MAG: HAMP domain-containing protein [Cytophagales bacterium]|nr:MAG: HAMP domain-containing protein [Cytophagales bacterium]TAF59639.1 MAG: HAMP domain-containing protein [Cytophagales bacterium]
MLKKIYSKLVLYFLLIGIVPLVVLTFLGGQNTSSILNQKVTDQLLSVREVKKRQLREYFKNLEHEITFLSESKFVLEAFKDLKDGFMGTQWKVEELENMRADLRKYYTSEFVKKIHLSPSEKPDSIVLEAFPSLDRSIYFQWLYLCDTTNTHLNTPFNEAQEKHISGLADFVNKFSHYDLFLVDNTSGFVLFSLLKEIDFGANLRTGKLAKTALGDAFRKTQAASSPNTVVLTDFTTYLPSFRFPAMFVAAPIFDGTRNVGTVILQIPVSDINNIMTGSNGWQSDGLGTSGECYLVGNDYKMRSDSRFLLQSKKNFLDSARQQGAEPDLIDKMNFYNTSILFQKVQTKSVDRALKGHSDTKVIKNYQNNNVLSSYSPVEIEGLNWVMVAEISLEEFHKPVDMFNRRVFMWVWLVILVIILIVRTIAAGFSKPILALVKGTEAIGQGDLSVRVLASTSDEIGTLTDSFNKMAADLQVKQEEIQQQKTAIESRNKQIQNAYNKIRSSIQYARRIQDALLPQMNLIKMHLPDSFVMYKPRDIVSGDFYWFTKTEDHKLIVAAVDCTGHGVPGAFMSMLGDAYLSQIIHGRRITEADNILNALHIAVSDGLKQQETDNRDGMDLALCVIDTQERKLTFAGAKNPLVYVKNQELNLVKGHLMPIGGASTPEEHSRVFVSQEILLEDEPTPFYIFSDGYQDQFGGEKNRKFMIRRFKELILANYHLPMEEQQDVYELAIEKWMSGHEQIDDILVIGFKI